MARVAIFPFERQMNIFTASDFRQMANKTRVITRKGIRAAIRAKTDTAMDFVRLQNMMNLNSSKTMQTRAELAISDLRKGTDLVLLDTYFRSCHLEVIIGYDKIVVRA